MITEVLSAMDQRSIAAAMHYGLCERTGDGRIIKHVGGGDARPVNTDSDGRWTYWRLITPITAKPSGCDMHYTVTARHVLVCDRSDDCSAIDHITTIAARMADVRVDGYHTIVTAYAIEADPLRAGAAEGVELPLSRAMRTIDHTITITITCPEGCQP